MLLFSVGVGLGQVVVVRDPKFWVTAFLNAGRTIDFKVVESMTFYLMWVVIATPFKCDGKEERRCVEEWEITTPMFNSCLNEIVAGVCFYYPFETLVEKGRLPDV